MIQARQLGIHQTEGYGAMTTEEWIQGGLPRPDNRTSKPDMGYQPAGCHTK